MSSSYKNFSRQSCCSSVECRGPLPQKIQYFGGTMRFGREGKAVWCESLNDNLLSVGRLCDEGFSVVFTARTCFVFQGDSFRGKPVYQQPRDSKTGLYPVFLSESVFLTEVVGDCRPMRLPGDSGGARGTSISPGSSCSSSTFSSHISLNDIRKHFGELSEWASAKIAEGRGAKRGPQLRIMFKNFEDKMCMGKLARFYVPSSVSNFQRWHEKLGHPGKKILRRCRIPGLVIPKSIPECDA